LKTENLELKKNIDEMSQEIDVFRKKEEKKKKDKKT